jgi:hypothetical protein
MSWLYSRVLVEEYLGESFLDGEQSAPSNGNPTPQAYCAQDKMTAFSRLSRFGMTYKPLTENLGEELLTLYLAAFHVKTLAQPEKAHNAKETNAPSESKRNTPTLGAQAGGSLNPTWVEWLMGWPLGWTDLKPLVTDKSHCVQQQHGKN